MLQHERTLKTYAKVKKKKATYNRPGTSPAVQWLGHHSNAMGVGLIPGKGAGIPRALQPKKRKIRKQKQDCNKFNKDF